MRGEKIKDGLMRKGRLKRKEGKCKVGKENMNGDESRKNVNGHGSGVLP